MWNLSVHISHNNERMCALHLSVTYNVMSDGLTSFQTKALLVSGAYMKIWPGTVKLKSFTGPKPQNDPRDGRNFGIFHTVRTLGPLFLLVLYVMYSVSLLHSVLPDVNCLAACEDWISLMYFYQAKVHWTQHRYERAWEFFLLRALLTFFMMLKVHIKVFKATVHRFFFSPPLPLCP